MKKMMLFTFMLGISLSFAGCSKKEDVGGSKPAANQAAPVDLRGKYDLYDYLKPAEDGTTIRWYSVNGNPILSKEFVVSGNKYVVVNYLGGRKMTTLTVEAGAAEISYTSSGGIAQASGKFPRYIALHEETGDNHLLSGTLSRDDARYTGMASSLVGERQCLKFDGKASPDPIDPEKMSSSFVALCKGFGEVLSGAEVDGRMEVGSEILR